MILHCLPINFIGKGILDEEICLSHLLIIQNVKRKFKYFSTQIIRDLIKNIFHHLAPRIHDFHHQLAVFVLFE